MSSCLEVVTPDVPGNSGLMVFAERVFPAFYVVIEHFFAVFADCHGFHGQGQHLVDTPGLDRYGIKLRENRVGIEAVLGPVTAAAGEENGLVVRRETLGYLIGRVVGEASGLSPLYRHHEDVHVSMAVGSEGDVLSVTAPDGLKVVGLVEGERSGFTAPDIYQVKVPFVGKDDLIPVGGYGGVADPLIGCG
jgi:hypothetical protein